MNGDAGKVLSRQMSIVIFFTFAARPPGGLKLGKPEKRSLLR